MRRERKQQEISGRLPVEARAAARGHQGHEREKDDRRAAGAAQKPGSGIARAPGEGGREDLDHRDPYPGSDGQELASQALDQAVEVQAMRLGIRLAEAAALKSERYPVMLPVPDDNRTEHHDRNRQSQIRPGREKPPAILGLAQR